MTTAALSGLRWGELVGLRLDRLDILRRTVTVDQQLVEDSGTFTIGPPKTRAGVRKVTLPRAAIEALAPHLANPACAETGLVFPSPQASYLRRSNFRRRTWSTATKIFAGTDLGGLRFHELRHTAASLAIAEGAHPVTIRDHLGHSSITVTMDRYGHLFDGHGRSLADALDAGFRKAQEARDAESREPLRVV